MSTTFTGFRVKKSEFWQCFDALKYVIYNEHPIFQNTNIDASKIDKIAEREDNHIGLQLFDVDSFYYVRFLSVGYWIENNLPNWLDKLPASVKPIMVHTGGASEEENDEANGIPGLCSLLEDVVDKSIRERHYFVVHLIDKDVIWHQMFLKRSEVKRER